MLFAIIEVSLVYFRAIVVEGAVREATRLIRTGQAQGSGDAASLFETTMCDNLLDVVSCGDLAVSVDAASDFLNLTVQPLFDENGEPINQGFQPGTGSETVIARVGFAWTFLTPLVGELLVADGTNVIRITSTTVFRNEPF